MAVQVSGLAGSRSEAPVLGAWGAESGAVKPNHVKVEAFRVNRVAAELAGDSADRISNRLLDQGFGSSLAGSAGFMAGFPVFRPSPAWWRSPAFS